MGESSIEAAFDFSEELLLHALTNRSIMKNMEDVTNNLFTVWNPFISILPPSYLE